MYVFSSFKSQGNFYQEYHSYQNYRPDDYGVDYTIYCCQHCHYEYDIFNDEEQVMNPKVFDPESGSECLSCPYCGHQLSEVHTCTPTPPDIMTGNVHVDIDTCFIVVIIMVVLCAGLTNN